MSEWVLVERRGTRDRRPKLYYRLSAKSGPSTTLELAEAWRFTSREAAVSAAIHYGVSTLWDVELVTPLEDPQPARPS